MKVDYSSVHSSLFENPRNTGSRLLWGDIKSSLIITPNGRKMQDAGLKRKGLTIGM